jgi:Trk K+ transport system NAD-binding subunit
MKYLGSLLSALTTQGARPRNLRLVLQYVLALVALVSVYSAIFHWLMLLEGREYSLVTGVYWTLVVMTTLGFGDITFVSDIGRLFSIVVLLSGVVSLLVMLPFVFIEFFYAPFLEAQSRARAPRALPPDSGGHVLLTQADPVALALIARLRDYGHPYALLVDTPERALEMADAGIRVMVGALDDPRTYVQARAGSAALVVATGGDQVNTNIAFTVREQAPHVRIIATARDDSGAEILALAGADRVLKLGEMLGQSLARRTIAGDARAHVIGHFGELVIAEALAAGTPLAGRTLAQVDLAKLAGVTVIGLWDRGAFAPAAADTPVTERSVLVLAGTATQFERYDALFCIYHVSRGSVVVIGSGRVGRAAADALAARGVDYRIIDRNPSQLRDPQRGVLGAATDRKVLEAAGIADAPAVLVTTHDDDTNIFLTIYCRRLRPDLQIISRATMEKNISTLHRAGADFVMSYASMGASAAFNFLNRGDILMLAEGLGVYRFPMPPTLAGRTLRDAGLHAAAQCRVIAVGRAGGIELTPDVDRPLPGDGHVVIVGDAQSERYFVEHFVQA